MSKKHPEEGRGRIMCGICGQLARDHQIGPCPQAPDRITLPALSTRSRQRQLAREKALREAT